MSTFLYASDLHGNREAYERLFAAEADAIVLGGDLLPHAKGTLEQRLELQQRFAEEVLAPLLQSRPSFWIAGNDDWAVSLRPLEGKGHSIHGRALPFLDGHWIGGYACVPITPFGMKDFDRFDAEGWTPKVAPGRCLLSRGDGVIEQVPLESLRGRGTIEADLERLAADSDPRKTVYVMHSPPRETALDRLYDGRPVGSAAIRRFIERHAPPLTLHGHVHESPGVDRLGSTVSVNPGDSLSGLRALRVDLRDYAVTPLLPR